MKSQVYDPKLEARLAQWRASVKVKVTFYIPTEISDLIDALWVERKEAGDRLCRSAIVCEALVLLAQQREIK